MRRITVVFAAVCTSGLLAAACGSSAKDEGEECVASSECKAGLICDFSQDPHVCRPEGSGPPPDANHNIPDANVVIPDSTPGAPDANPPPDASAPPDAPVGTPLTVKNYASWCDVTVNGNPAFGTASQVFYIDPPGTINVSATAHSGFQLGTAPWHDTDGDTGAGEANPTTETVGATADCIWVCCEFTGGGGCPTTDQCP